MSTMTGVEATWVRDHAWTKPMRRHHVATGGALPCACDYGMTGHCHYGRCRECQRGEPLASAETFVTRKDGSVMSFREDFEHPSITSATGPRFERYAVLFLADRLCRWVCSCRCHRVGHVVRDQLDMLDLIGGAP